MDETAQISFALKFSGEFLLIWAMFPKSDKKLAEHWVNFAQIGKISPGIFAARV
jgi:hypothetical protein